MIYLDEKTTAALISHELAYKAVKAAFSSVQDQHSSIFPVVNASGP
ncbi:ornithine cyclodeaminase family protein, partial [Vibrio parahaemolyticus]|nr:ornithine cyclodeaminase family protein [Vibrio parahaemolyticus]